MIEQASLVIGGGNWAVKSDSLLGYKINGGKYYPREMSVVRATTGTRINEDGLVELVPYNLLTYSEQFDNAFWNKVSVTISANSTIAPDGTLTADSLIATSVNSQHRTDFSITGNGGTIYTFSCYAKANQYSRIQLRTGDDSICKFNLSSGTVTSTAGTATATIENIGNGWYRCSVCQIRTSSSTMFSRINILDNSDNSTFVGNDIDGLYIWGAQLVEGSSALDYLPTTDRLDVARIDYSSGSGALLVEPQRTNVLQRSQEFDNGFWTKQEITITANATTAPDGTQTADKATPTTVTGTHQIQTGTLISSTQCAFGVFAKADGYNTIEIFDRASAANGARFNILNGTIEQTFGTATATITDFGNGWYRCVVVANTTGVRFYIPTAASNFTGDGTSGIFVWGAQLEAGSYPTSYIPTQAATVTRNADVISKTGIAGLIGQTEGVLFTEVAFGSNDNVNKWISFLYLTSSEYIGIYTAANGRFRAEVFNGGAIQFAATSSVLALPNEKHKFALAYKANDFAFYIDGVQIALDNSGTVPACNQVSFNYNTTATNLTQRYYSSLALYKTRLTNAELATLTTI